MALGQNPASWAWNGRTDAGTSLPDGAYTYAIQGVTAGGASVPLTATALGTASGVQRQGNTLQLLFGSTALGMDQVARVDSN